MSEKTTLEQIDSSMRLGVEWLKLISEQLKGGGGPVFSDILTELRDISRKLTEYNDNVILILSKKLSNLELEKETLTKLNKYLEDWV